MILDQLNQLFMLVNMKIFSNLFGPVLKFLGGLFLVKNGLFLVNLLLEVENGKKRYSKVDDTRSP